MTFVFRLSSFVQKEEGLREEHGSFPRRSLRRGPRLINPPRSPHKATPCGIAPLSRRGADRARPALRCRNGVSAETPAIEKGSCQGRQALTEGLWVSYRNGLSVTGRLLLHRACNPSASHPLSTSPYTGEARDGRRWPAPHRFAGLTRGGRRSLAPHRFEGAVGKARSPSFFVSVPRPKEAGLRAEHRGDLLTGG